MTKFCIKEFPLNIESVLEFCKQGPKWTLLTKYTSTQKTDVVKIQWLKWTSTESTRTQNEQKLKVQEPTWT